MNLTSTTTKSNPKGPPSPKSPRGAKPRRRTNSLSEHSYTPQSIYTPDAIVHLQYEYGQEPLKPGARPKHRKSSSSSSSVYASNLNSNADEGPSNSEEQSEHWTRFVCLSDTHGKTCPVPDGDVLLHSGDLTNLGCFGEVKETMEWLSGLPHKVKIVIAGNHDLTFHQGWYEKTWEWWHDEMEDESAIMDLVKGKAAQEAGIVYLDCEEYQFSLRRGGKVWSVYGSPWQPEFGGWAFNYKRSQGRVISDKIPKVDILLTHGPPRGILDETSGREKVGCGALTAHLAGVVQPRLHCFGHIHESRGAYIHTWNKSSPSCPAVQVYSKVTQTPGSPQGNRTVFVNASNSPIASAWRPSAYRLPFAGPGFQPIIVDLRDNVDD